MADDDPAGVDRAFGQVAKQLRGVLPRVAIFAAIEQTPKSSIDVF
ncbi:hypothetical protein [Halegenticoccus tardaugens]|nr:hypothetical protein [Halegenticoccus tardaugens]